MDKEITTNPEPGLSPVFVDAPAFTPASVTLWINDKKKTARIKKSSAETYEYCMNQFLNFANARNISQPTRDDIAAWRDSLIDAEKSEATIQIYMTSLRIYCGWLVQIGKLATNPADGIRGGQVEREHKKDPLTKEQCKAVLNTIDRSTDRGKRDYALISLMMTTGTRTIEMQRANRGDLVLLPDYAALFIQGKGKTEKNDYVKLSGCVAAAVTDYLETRGTLTADSPLFASTSRNNNGGRMTTRAIRAAVVDALTAAGIKSNRITTHSLRHTAATVALLEGAELEEVRQVLRHQSINTTLIYAHAIDRAKNTTEQKISDAIFNDQKTEDRKN